jgi:hypothetical protein
MDQPAQRSKREGLQSVAHRREQLSSSTGDAGKLLTRERHDTLRTRFLRVSRDGALRNEITKGESDQ